MPALPDVLARRAGVALEKRISIPCCNASSPPGLVEAATVDPWSKSGKYALGWVYFSIILLILTTILRWYNFWNDKVRVAIHKETVEEEMEKRMNTLAMGGSPDTEDYEMSALGTDKSTTEFFPREWPAARGAPPPRPGADEETGKPAEESAVTSFMPLNVTLAACRWVFYRPLPNWTIRAGWRPIVFPSISVIAIVSAALVFVVLYCFVPQPLYWQSIRFGSPPLAIRAGMIAVAMMPWIVALAMKANFISMLTGIGHERLNVLHRWLAYLCLLLSLIHMVPFYITPIWEDGGRAVFTSFFTKRHFYAYGTGIVFPPTPHPSPSAPHVLHR